MSKSQLLIDIKKHYIQLLLFWFHFSDLLIKFMKMRLFYILYCPPTPATWLQGPFVPFAILYVPIYWSSPPPLRPISGEGEVGPSRGHAFGWRGERGETGITPPHAGWQRTQKILVLVIMMPHMQNGQGQNHPCFFVSFFILSKS
jgi:hypothetical protein